MLAVALLTIPVCALAGEPTETTAAEEAPQMIPEPNQGHAPRDAGDRGGAAQIALLVGVTGGIALIVALVVRDSRRSRPQGPG